MRAMREMTILVCILASAAWVYGQSGQVRFRGTVMVEEKHDVIPVCYGDYHVTVEIGQVLEDPNGVFGGIRLPGQVIEVRDDPLVSIGLTSVQVCYKEGLGLVVGEGVEVNGYYWNDGSCPRQYCQRVQILAKTDSIRRFAGVIDDDWMVDGDTMYSIPPGNVGIGTSTPREKLHVVGNLLIEGASPAWLDLMATLGNDAGISMTTTGAGVNTWKILRSGATADLTITEQLPYPPFSGGQVVVKTGSGNVGIGTTDPDEKLHVVGTALIEAAGGGMFDEALRVVKAGTGRQLAAYFINPTDGVTTETELQIAGGKMLPWGWSIKATSGLFTISNVAVLPPALNVTSTGRIGVGVTAPSYRLELPNIATAEGQARANKWNTYSSVRWKTNVRTIDHAMDKVRDLRGVYFDWKERGTHDMGMIAEEVGRVVPEVVDYEANGTDAKSLAYDRLVALLVEAVKEQEARITDLEEQLAQSKRLEQRLETLERLVQQQQPPATDGRIHP